MCKTDKSVLTRTLEKEFASLEPAVCDVIIYDGFFMLHSLKDIPVTFRNISQKILQMFAATNAKIVIICFDNYCSPSNDNEHSMRARIRGNTYVINGPDQKRSFNFNKELQNINFKDALI